MTAPVSDLTAAAESLKEIADVVRSEISHRLADELQSSVAVLVEAAEKTARLEAVERAARRLVRRDLSLQEVAAAERELVFALSAAAPEAKREHPTDCTCLICDPDEGFGP